jgi:single-strand DNA-binding protein
MLRVTAIGNLGSDAELRYSANDRQIAQFRIAINQVRTNAAGEREDSTEWFRINVVGRQAEYASHLQKGQRVLVDGRLQITHFQRRDGTPGVGFDVWADEVRTSAVAAQRTVTTRTRPRARLPAMSRWRLRSPRRTRHFDTSTRARSRDVAEALQV